MRAFMLDQLSDILPPIDKDGAMTMLEVNNGKVVFYPFAIVALIALIVLLIIMPPDFWIVAWSVK